jgi:Tol biopolymer transport system component
MRTCLLCGSNDSPLDLFRKDSNGASAEELLLGDSAFKDPNSVSPDGKLLLFDRSEGNNVHDLWVLPLTQAQSGRKPEPRVFLRTPFDKLRGQFSPDGHWVAYESNESGQAEVYAVPFPGPGGKRQISFRGGRFPRWRRDGKELFYVTPDRELIAAELTAGNGTLEVGRVQKLFKGIVITNTDGGSYEVSADGQKFLVVEDSVTSSSALTLVQNWPAALKK